MVKSRGQRHFIDMLFTLALFSVFTAASLIVVLIGADVYRAAISQMDESFEVNTTLTYIATKIRQHDSTDAIRIDDIDGVSALVLSRPIGDEIFETWIYHHDGVIRELFINRQNRAALWAGAGQALVEVYDFRFGMIQEGLIYIVAQSEDGFYGRMVVGLRSN
jgi:hypothetical protein